MRVNPPQAIMSLVALSFVILTFQRSNKDDFWDQRSAAHSRPMTAEIANQRTELRQRYWGDFELYWIVNGEGQGLIWIPNCFVGPQADKDCLVNKYKIELNGMQKIKFQQYSKALRDAAADGINCIGVTDQSYGEVSWEVGGSTVQAYYSMGCEGESTPQGTALQAIRGMSNLLQASHEDSPFETVTLTSISSKADSLSPGASP